MSRLSFVGSIAIVLLALCRAAQGQPSDDATDAPVAASEPALRQDDTGQTELMLVPVPILDPTLGAGLALAGIATFGSDGGEGVPRSTLAVAGAYTDERSWAGGLGGKLYLAEDRYRLSAVLAYASVNLDYYGRSDDSIFFDRPLGFNLEGWVSNLHAQARIADNLYGGLQIRTLRPTASINADFDIISNVGLELTLSAAGPTLEYDTRDFPNDPTRGELLSSEVLFYRNAIWSGHTFSTSSARWGRYATIASDLVLATEVLGAWGSSQTPFFLLPYVSLRGFPAGQYLGQSVLQGQGELRWQAADGIGLVAFAGAGAAMPQGWEPGAASRAWSGGIGARYRIFEPDRLNVGVDLAYGSTDDVALYFRIGEAF